MSEDAFLNRAMKYEFTTLSDLFLTIEQLSDANIVFCDKITELEAQVAEKEAQLFSICGLLSVGEMNIYIDSLRTLVTKLEAENAELRAQLAVFQDKGMEEGNAVVHWQQRATKAEAENAELRNYIKEGDKRGETI